MGVNDDKRVLVDSDALIGLIHKDDALHKISSEILTYFVQNNFSVVIPYAIVLEAATALSTSKAVKRPDLAVSLLNYYLTAEKGNQNFDFEVSGLVAKLFDAKTSKKNTPFDHYVLALAMKNDIKYVFSFDTFYRKKGLTLAEDLLKS